LIWVSFSFLNILAMMSGHACLNSLIQQTCWVQILSLILLQRISFHLISFKEEYELQDDSDFCFLRIWIFGGFDGTNRLNDLYSFDTKTQKYLWFTFWTISFSFSFFFLSFVLTKWLNLKNDVIFIVHIFLCRWTKVNIAKEPPMGRSGHKMVRYGSSTIYIFGGIDNQGNYSNELFSFDVNRNPVEMKWIKTTVICPFHLFIFILRLIQYIDWTSFFFRFCCIEWFCYVLFILYRVKFLMFVHFIPWMS
jgi:hypothetical protein